MLHTLTEGLRKAGLEIRPTVSVENASDVLSDAERLQSGRDLTAALNGKMTDVSRQLTKDETRLWSLDAMAKGDASLTINYGLRIDEPLARDRLERAAWKCFLRHPAFRRRVALVAGEPTLTLLESAPEQLVEEIAVAQSGNAAQFVIDDVRRLSEQAFDLATGPLVRIVVYNCGGSAYLWILAHHLISDLRALLVLHAHLLADYFDVALPRPLPPPNLASDSTGPTREENQAFWRNYLAGADFSPIFGGDEEDSARRIRSARAMARNVPRETLSGLRTTAGSLRTSPSVIAFAAFAIAVHAVARRKESCVSFPFLKLRPGEQETLALAASPLLIRLSCEASTPIVELAQRIEGDLVSIMRHAGHAFEDIVGEASATDAARFRQELFFSFGRIEPLFEKALGGRPAELVGIHRARSDAALSFWLQATRDIDRGAIGLEYDSSRFTAQYAEGFIDLYLAVLDALSQDSTGTVGRIIQSPALQPPKPVRPLRIGVTSTFACAPIEASIRTLCDRLALTAFVPSAHYGTVLGDLLNPASSLLNDRNGFCVVLLRVEDFIRDNSSAAAGQDPMHLAAAEYAAALAAASRHAKCPIILVIAPPSPSFADAGPWAKRRAQAEDIIAQSAAALPNVAVIRGTDALSAAGRAKPWDAAGDRLAHLPYPDAVFADLGRSIVRVVHERVRRPFKVIVVDCDNTLWKGVVGEEGPRGVEVTREHFLLQRRLKQASAAGFLICLCSKNEEQDVLDVFTLRDDLGLDLREVTRRKINWSPKSQNIRELASELSLGLDSFVFLDDNPIEIAEVEANCPQVTSVLIPTDPVELALFAAEFWPFDKFLVTAEDSARTQMYQAEAGRMATRTGASDYAGFIAGLQLRASVLAPDPALMPRLSQMTRRTNQFNACPIERSEVELTALASDPNAFIRAFDVEDRFGAYGVVGMIAARIIGGALDADTFLMSCRVLGRGLENRMVRILGELALARGAPLVRIRWRATSRNAPARRFLESLPGRRLSDPDGGDFVELDAAQAASLAFSAAQAEQEAAAYEATADANAATSLGDPRAPIVPPWIWRELALDLSSGAALARRASPEPWRPLASKAPQPQVARAEPMQEGRAILAALLELVGAATGIVADAGRTLEAYALDSIQVVRLLSNLEARTGIVADFETFHPKRTLAEIADALGRGRSDEGTTNADADAVRIQIARDLVLLRSDVPLAGERARAAIGAPAQLLLTGATGFLGGRLVSELLAQTDATIHCLVRADNDQAAADRLRASLVNAGLPQEARAIGANLLAIAGDMEKPWLGLSRERFEQLSAKLDAVYHNAAKVSFIAPYEELRGAIVEGTRWVLRLAAAGRAKRVHYVSTVAVFMTDSCLGAPAVGENELPETCEDAFFGYAQAKWTSERLLRTARDRGMDISIYRPGNITGDSATGYWAVGDAFTRMLAGVAATSSVPAIGGAIDFTPVDFVARALVALSIEPAAANRNWHLVNPVTTTLADLVAASEAGDRPLATVPYAMWIARVAAHINQDADHPSGAALPILRGRMSRYALSMPELLAIRPTFATTQTTAALARCGIACPRVGADMLGRYFSYLDGVGYGPWRNSESQRTPANAPAM